MGSKIYCHFLSEFLERKHIPQLILFLREVETFKVIGTLAGKLCCKSGSGSDTSCWLCKGRVANLMASRRGRVLWLLLARQRTHLTSSTDRTILFVGILFDCCTLLSALSAKVRKFVRKRQNCETPTAQVPKTHGPKRLTLASELDFTQQLASVHSLVHVGSVHLFVCWFYCCMCLYTTRTTAKPVKETTALTQFGSFFKLFSAKSIIDMRKF